ncbi:MAG: lysostaphin resistance A-like protein [Pleurocapsa sp.]
MTIKRVILTLLTVVAIAKVFLSLNSSLSQPQIQSRLELYQTNLVLQVAEFKSNDPEDLDITKAIKSLVGQEPYQEAIKQYQKAEKEAILSRENFQELAAIETAKEGQSEVRQIIDKETAAKVSPQKKYFQQQIVEIDNFIREIYIKQGLLNIARDRSPAALTNWNQAIERVKDTPDKYAQTATVLQSLWQDNVQPPVNSEEIIKQNLDGWFRDRALTRLYELENRTDALAMVQAEQQQLAYRSLSKLAVISGIPVFGGITGIILLIFLIVQLFFKQEKSILAINSNVIWETPWNWEITWQVLIVGFFFIGQIVLPVLLGLSGVNPGNASLRIKALYVFGTYIMMAASGILVLYFSLKPFFPLPQSWFKFKFISNWFVWGLGGYLIAIPSVLLVSLINQQLWNGQGGSNPLLFLALQAQDRVALAIFFITASIAAPIFEEIMFRGFLLPSLTRYIPVWGAIVVSGFIFAIAHLSLSEVLPLATLGIILGVVYTRSRNLLAPMLLHSLWNSGTLISLFVLGSGV